MHDPQLMNGFETIATIRRFSSIFWSGLFMVCFIPLSRAKLINAEHT